MRGMVGMEIHKIIGVKTFREMKLKRKSFACSHNLKDTVLQSGVKGSCKGFL